MVGIIDNTSDIGISTLFLFDNIIFWFTKFETQSLKLRSDYTTKHVIQQSYINI